MEMKIMQKTKKLILVSSLKGIILIITFSAVILPNSFASLDGLIYKSMENLVRKCLSHKEYRICNNAFHGVHKLQLNALNIRNYPCQTRLLGLESYLIMNMNKKLKKIEMNRILKEVKDFC